MVNRVLDSGLYVLWLEVTEAASVSVGALGTCQVEPGLFAYVGSARKRRAARIARHLRFEKRRHWHIDYLRPAGRIIAVTLVDTSTVSECGLVDHLMQTLEGTRAIPRFGASDCGCGGHLLRFAHPGGWTGLTAPPSR